MKRFFCDCYRNMGHFLCSIERIMRFVNAHLHCVVALSAVFLLRCANTQDHQNCCAVKSHSRALASFQNNGNYLKNKELFSGGSWWKWPGGLRNLISGWTYRIVALPLAVYNGVSSHTSSPKLMKLVIFSRSYWYIENIHFSLMKPNPYFFSMYQ